MGYGNGPWQACPWVTLTPEQLYITFQYPQTLLMLPAMQNPTPESIETHPDTIDCKIRRFRPNMTACSAELGGLLFRSIVSGRVSLLSGVHFCIAGSIMVLMDI